MNDTEQIQFNPCYPLFIVGDDNGSITVAAADDGTECLVAFATKELGELHVEEVLTHGLSCKLVAIDSAEALLEMLRAVVEDVRFMAWNSTSTQSVTRLLPIPRLIDLLDI